MDTKGGQLPQTDLASSPLVEEYVMVYIAVKGSLHANDCSVFGLGQEEVKALTKKYPGSGVVVNGVSMKTNVLDTMNSLSQLGYKIISSTGEAEITWTMQPFYGDKDRVNYLIDRSRDPKEAVNATDNAGYTPLHYAARKGHVDICRMLLLNGALIDAETKSGKATALHKASASGKLDVLKFLIQAGACVNIQDVDGQTILHKALGNNNMELANFILTTYPHLRAVKDNRGKRAVAGKF